MAKRFTDSEKWKDSWFMDLPTKYKLFWLYLLDECDNAGIWKVNFKVASFYVGEDLEPLECRRVLKDRINFINDEYWYLIKFIKYQYKSNMRELNPKNKAQLSVIRRLIDFDIYLGPYKDLTSASIGAQDKDKDKYIDIEELKNHFKSNAKYFYKQFPTLQSSKGHLKYLLDEFEGHVMTEDNSDKTEFADWMRHFKNWVTIKVKNGYGLN